MTIATGPFKYLSFKKQTALGTKAPAGAAGSAQYQRRTSSNLAVKKGSFQSEEINRSQMRRDVRHGTPDVQGTISQELSVGGHQGPFQSVLRAASAAVYNSGALTTVAAASTGEGVGTLTRSAGDWSATGKFKVMDVVDIAGFTAPATANNTRAVIIALTATVMTVATLSGSDLVAKAAGDSVTVTLAGRKIAIPQSGHTRDYWTIEHYHADFAESEVFSDCVFTAANVTVAPNSMTKVDFPVMGLKMDKANAEYFTSPANEPAGGILAGAALLVVIDGVVYRNCTGFTLNVNGNYAMPEVLGGRKPDILPGVIDVGVNMTFLLENMTLRDIFLQERTVSVGIVMHDAASLTAPGFTAFALPKCKLNDHTPEDAQQGLTVAVPGTGLENTAGSANDTQLPTALSVQDSAFT